MRETALSERYAAAIEAELASDDCAAASEVVRAALRGLFHRPPDPGLNRVEFVIVRRRASGIGLHDAIGCRAGRCSTRGGTPRRLL